MIGSKITRLYQENGLAAETIEKLRQLILDMGAR